MNISQLGIAAPIIAIVVVLIGILFFFKARYRTVGPDTALIVTGSFLEVSGGRKHVKTDQDSGRKVKIITGGGTLVLPIFQQASTMSLNTFQLDIQTPEVLTVHGVKIIVNANAMVKIQGTIGGISTAAEQFLGKEDSVIQSEIKEVLEGHLRSILAGMSVEKANGDRKEFGQKVEEHAKADLNDMGIMIQSFNIQHIADREGYLDALGAKRIAEVKRDARIHTATADQEARTKEAESNRIAEEAELKRETEIAEATRNKEIKVSAFRKEQETAKADADAAYAVKEAERSAEIKTKNKDAEIAERERMVILETKEIEVRERKYDAEVRKKADAEAYEVEKRSQADKTRRQNESDAEKYEKLAQAEADSKQVELDGTARAKATREQGEAEAEVIRQKGLAEAEALQKKAEAFEKYGQAAIMDMIVHMLPDYARAIAEPMSNVESIKIIDTGNGDGVNRLSGSVTNMMTNLQNTLKEATGIDVKELLENYSGKQNLKGELSSITDSLERERSININTDKDSLAEEFLASVETDTEPKQKD